MSRYLLDTGLVIRHFRGHRPTVQLLRELGSGSRLCISVITRLELFAGMHPDEKYATHRLLSRFVNFDVDKQVAEKAGSYIYSARKEGPPVQTPGAIIAATAVVHQLTLVTFNRDDFARWDGLSLYPLP